MLLQVGSLTLQNRSLHLGDNRPPVRLFPKEARLLAILMRHANEVVSRSKLMQEVWQTDYLGDTRTLDVHICWLRRKVEPNPSRPRVIVTKRGEGYRLRVPEIG
jgi:DNA-binding response OmpR family regulator